MDRLTLVVVAKDAGAYIERLLVQARKYADVVMTFVDNKSADNTLDLCRLLADTTELIETPGYIEPVLEYVYSVPTTPWILRLDADELIGERFVEQRDALLERRDAAIFLPRYAVLRGEKHYLAGRPWYPDYQPRLFRRGAIIPSKTIHFAPQILGIIGILEDVHIFHLKFLYRNKEEREALAEHYDVISRGAGTGVEFLGHQLPERMAIRTMKQCEETIA